MRWNIVCAIAIACCGLSRTATADDAEIVQGFDARIASLTVAAAGLASLDFSAPAVSVPALASGLRDAEAAWSWVRSNLTFDPYGGSLRGGRGALLTLGGNSVDRALLLGELVGAMGHEWRVAMGTLSDQQASDLLRTATVSGSYAGEGVPASAPVYDAAADVRRRGVVAGHAWVRARIDREWVDLDPTFPALAYGEAVATAEQEFEPDELPSGFRRTVTIGVYFDTTGTDGGELLSHTADLADVSYRNLTVVLDHDRSVIIPTLEVPGETITGSRIRTQGLSRVWLQFVFRTGDVERRVVRDIFTAGSELDVLSDGDVVLSTVLLPGFVGTDYFRAVLAVLLGGFSGEARQLEEAVEEHISLDELQAELGAELELVTRSQIGRALGITALAFAHASDRFALRAAGSLGVRPYFAEPRVLIAAAVSGEGGYDYQLDLRENAVVALPYSGVPPASADAFASVCGRMDSGLATQVLTMLTGREAVGVQELTEAAEAAGAASVTVHPGTVRRVGTLPLSTEAIRRLTNEVNEQGFFALAPNQPAEVRGHLLLAWWRIDPGTGAVLGVSEWGTHGASTFAAEREGSSASTVRVRVVDQTLELLAALFANAATIAEGREDVQATACGAMCDVVTMRRSLCSDERDRSVPRLSSCMRGILPQESVGGVGVVPIATSCSLQLYDFYCGVAVLDGMSGGSVGFVEGPSPAPTSPLGYVAPLDWSACACER